LISSVFGENAKDYVLMPPLKGPDGHQEFSQHLYKAEHGLVISSICKNKEAVVRMYDYINSSWENMVEAVMGLEEQGLWKRVGETQWATNDAGAPEGMKFVDWQAANCWAGRAPTLFTSDWVTKYRSVEGVAKEKLDMVLEYKPYFLDEMVPMLMLPNDMNEEFIEPPITEVTGFLLH
jgi:hypothetical protein